MRRTLGAAAAGAIFALGVAAVVVLIIALAGSGRSTRYDDIARDFGVTIVWDTSLVPSCGDYGCHTVLTPGVIYVSPELGDDTERVVLHELGHVMQWRLGIPKDECGADQFAASLGGTWGSYCAPEDRR